MTTKAIDKLHFPLAVVKAYDDPEGVWACIVEGYGSTVDPDRINDVVEPKAFEELMPNYMASNPLFTLNHDLSGLPLGNLLDYRIDEKGIWIKAGIGDDHETARGAASMAKKKRIRQFSFIAKPLEYNRRDGGNGLHIYKVEPLEFSLVSLAMNPNARVAVAKAIQDFRKLNHEPITVTDEPTPIPVAERNKAVENIDELVKKGIQPYQQKIDEQLMKFSDLEGKITKFMDFERTMKDAVEACKKNDSDLKTLIDKSFEDFKKNYDELQTHVKDLRRKSVTHIGDFGPITTKSVLEAEPRDLQELYGKDTSMYSKCYKLQKLNDQVMFVDLIKAQSSIHMGGDYFQKPRAERIKSLKCYQEMQHLIKAMDTATATEGLEFNPDFWSSQLIELVRYDQVLAPLFEELFIPSDVYTMPQEGADIFGELMGETTTVQTGVDNREQTPGTGNIQLSTKKYRVRVQFSRELDEGSIIAMMQYVMNKVKVGAARTEERTMVRGDSSVTHMDENVTDSYDFRKAYAGLGYYALTAIANGYGIDLGTFNEDNIRKIRANMGPYGLYRSRSFYLMSPKTYMMKALRKLESYKTLQTYDSRAIIISGEVAAIDAIPVVLSEFMPDNLEASGKYETAGNHDKSTLLLIDRSQFLRPMRRPFEVAVVPNIIQDCNTVVAFKRCGFTPKRTPSADNPIVNCGYNVDVNN